MIKLVLCFVLGFGLLTGCESKDVKSDTVEKTKTNTFVEGKRRVLDFTATWCGPCRQMERDSWSATSVKKELKYYKGGDREKVDIDQYPDIARKYNVRSIPTIIILDENGKEIGRWMGYLSATRLTAILESYKR